MQQVNIKSLKEDSNQPRRFFNKEKIEEMASTIRKMGVINPIEIDEKNVIITGALRFRAAKLAGLNEIPCKILSGFTKDERFVRQAVENLQRDDLTDTEKCDLVVKLKKIYPEKSTELLGKLIGKSHTFIGRYCTAVQQPPYLLREFRKGKIPVRSVVEIASAPAEYKRELTRKVVKEGIPLEGIQRISERLRDASPQVARRVLRANYTGQTEREVAETIRRVAPNVLEKAEDVYAELKKLVEGFSNFLKQNPNIIFTANQFYGKRVWKLLDELREQIDDYIGSVPKKLK